MEFIYLLIVEGSESEDVIIYLSEEEAIEISKKFSTNRVEIFSKSVKGGYRPTYNYYLNGEYYQLKL